MKISFMTFMAPDWSLEELTAGACRHGYDGIEIRVDARHKHGVELSSSAEFRREVRRRFADAGIEVACLATSCTFAAENPAARRVNIDALKRHIELAADVGARGIRVFGGVLPERMTLESGIRVVAEDLAGGCAAACEAGVGVWLETHDSFMRAEYVADIVERAGRPCLGVTWDLMHPIVAGENTSETWGFLKEGKTVRHTHLHDGRREDGEMRLVPIGDGCIPFHEPLGLLRAADYRGYLSGEYWTQLGPPEDALACYIAAVRRLLRET